MKLNIRILLIISIFSTVTCCIAQEKNETIIINQQKSIFLNSEFMTFFYNVNTAKSKEYNGKLDTLKAIADFLNKNDSFYLQINIVCNEDYITKNKLWEKTIDEKLRKEYFRNTLAFIFHHSLRDSLKGKSYNVKNLIIFQENGFSYKIPDASRLEFVIKKLPQYENIKINKVLVNEVFFWKDNKILITSNSKEELHIATYFLKKYPSEQVVIETIANTKNLTEASQKQLLVKESLMKRGINEKRIIIKPTEVKDNVLKTKVSVRVL